jgi:hypothetical protein
MHANAIQSTRDSIDRLLKLGNKKSISKKEDFPLGCKVRIVGEPKTNVSDWHTYNDLTGEVTIEQIETKSPDRRGMIGIVKEYWYEMLSIQFVGNDKEKYQFSPDDCRKL